MKTVSIRDLHAATGRHVRAALHEPVVITEHGRRLAVIKPFCEGEVEGGAFPRRRAERLPAVSVDTTLLIAADRDGR
jgi:antitoxin (DNA-binding transcriptional repressor) of toxin-antitoxin stability system